jgi:hypothetical protein
MSARKPIVEEEMSTKAAASLFGNQVEKAIHPFYGTRRILGKGLVLCLLTARFGCGRSGKRAHG